MLQDAFSMCLSTFVMIMLVPTSITHGWGSQSRQKDLLALPRIKPGPARHVG
jgi:hypothetical protein